MLRSHGIFLYDDLHVTRLARFYTGSLAPQPAFHDSLPRLLASPSAPRRSPDRVAAFYHRTSHPVTRLLPLAATPNSMPDRGTRARPCRLQRVSQDARQRSVSLSRGL